jgi:hypothetical protein
MISSPACEVLACSCISTQSLVFNLCNMWVTLTSSHVTKWTWIKTLFNMWVYTLKTSTHTNIKTNKDFI